MNPKNSFDQKIGPTIKVIFDEVDLYLELNLSPLSHLYPFIFGKSGYMHLRDKT